MFNVIIIGAGASGIGCAIQLKQLGIKKVLLLDKGEIGHSFKSWPAEMRFISPSFPGNAFELLDLNAVALQTSPAFSLNTEHPTGKEYAQYLELMVEFFGLDVQQHTEVTSIAKDGERFLLQTTQGKLKSKFIIYAGGDFQHPNRAIFPGAELCLHNSEVRSWKKLSGEEFIVVGGYESAVDAAVNLSLTGKKVTILSKNDPTADPGTSDPSVALSPYTADRLKAELLTGNITIFKKQTITTVEKNANAYIITAKSGKSWTSKTKPILATGFAHKLGIAESLFAFDKKGIVKLTELDESTQTPNIFLAGPIVKHENVILCFIYKYRQRFAVVTAEIATRLGKDVGPFVDHYKKHNMYLDDLSSCCDECVC